MRVRNKVNKILRLIEEGKISQSFAEQFLEEAGDLEVLEALQEIWDQPEIGEME